MNVYRSSAFLFGLLFVGSIASWAHALPKNEDVARAQALFDEGTALKQRGRFAEACPKLEESQRLDPGLGTQYHLADCWEKQGRTASAWSLFEEIARQAAVSDQKDRERVARERATELAPRVPRLVIAVPVTSDVAGLEITRDGVIIARDRWNAPVPLDPGAHEIVARIGDGAWRTSILLEARARTETVVVPDVARRVHAQSSTNDAPRGVFEVQREAVEPGDTRRAIGFATTGAGVVGLGAGAFFLLRAMHEHAVAEDLGCGNRTCPSREGVDARSRAVAAGNLATVGFATGAALTGFGIYLVASAPRGSTPRAVVASASPFGVNVGGTF